MKLLALETAGPWCSAGLMIDDQIEQRLEHAPRRHADLVLGMLDDLLAASGIRLTELDAIVYGRGPGAFTGVRIAAAVAQGIAFGAERPVIGISTLAATAQSAYRQTGERSLACALDARMDEVYWGCFQVQPDQHMVAAVGDEAVVAPEATEALGDQSWCGVGDGWTAYPSLIDRHRNRVRRRVQAIAEARDLLTLAKPQLESGHSMRAADAVPTYLRNRVAAVSRPRG
jgi:tRNA threonylcarbamoyladenosine biosynthesis protein TsaB